MIFPPTYYVGTTLRCMAVSLTAELVSIVELFPAASDGLIVTSCGVRLRQASPALPSSYSVPRAGRRRILNIGRDPFWDEISGLGTRWWTHMLFSPPGSITSQGPL